MVHSSRPCGPPHRVIARSEDQVLRSVSPDPAVPVQLVSPLEIQYICSWKKGVRGLVLKLEHVTKRFGHFTAVDNLSLIIPKNEIFGFLGANGAGKTTTFRMILGLLEPSGGKIGWDEMQLNYSTSHLVGYLPEERGLYPKLKVRDQIVYLARLRGM